MYLSYVLDPKVQTYLKQHAWIPTSKRVVNNVVFNSRRRRRASAKDSEHRRQRANAKDGERTVGKSNPYDY